MKIKELLPLNVYPFTLNQNWVCIRNKTEDIYNSTIEIPLVLSFDISNYASLNGCSVSFKTQCMCCFRSDIPFCHLCFLLLFFCLLFN